MWTKLDDRLNSSAKLNGLSDAAYRLWIVVLIESRQKENLWLSGRIPREVLGSWAQNRWKGKQLDRLVAELVRAKAGGRSGFGLWEPEEDGWQIHDWEQYSPDKRDHSLTAQDVARLGGLASAASRKARTGSAVPRGARNAAAEPVRSTSSEPVRQPVRQPVRSTSSEPTEPPDPDPDLTNSPLPLARTLELVRSNPEGSEGFRGPGRMTAEELDAALEQREAKCQ
jgi:hypothetical protein